MHDGQVHPVRIGAATDGAITVHSPKGAAVLEPGAARWVVAYGSNASPGRLVDKGLDQHGAVLLPARMFGWVPAYEHRRTGYGSVPLTLVPHDGAVTDTWVLAVHLGDTPTVDLSEGRVADADHRDLVEADPDAPDDGRRAPPGSYRLGHVGEVVVAEDAVLRDAVAYLPGPRTGVQIDRDGRWRTWPGTDQTSARDHVDVDGLWRHAPVASDTVLGPWPRAGPVARS